MPSASSTSLTPCETSSSSFCIRRGASLDDRYRASEAAVHLSELDTDVAAPQYEEMAGKKVDLHHRGVGDDR